jgi:hypothetical protein
MRAFAVLLFTIGVFGALGPSEAGWAAGSARGPFVIRGEFLGVVDATTLQVRVGRRTRLVRLIGVKAPAGRCSGLAVTALHGASWVGEAVVLSGDRALPRSDGQGHLLADRTARATCSPMLTTKVAPPTAVTLGSPFSRKARSESTRRAASAGSLSIRQPNGLPGRADWASGRPTKPTWRSLRLRRPGSSSTHRSRSPPPSPTTARATPKRLRSPGRDLSRSMASTGRRHPQTRSEDTAIPAPTISAGAQQPPASSTEAISTRHRRNQLIPA